MIRKKQYITPLADFSLIEEEVSLLDGSIRGEGENQKSDGETLSPVEQEEKDPINPAKISSDFVFEYEIEGM